MSEEAVTMAMRSCGEQMTLREGLVGEGEVRWEKVGRGIVVGEALVAKCPTVGVRRYSQAIVICRAESSCCWEDAMRDRLDAKPRLTGRAITWDNLRNM